MNIHFIPKHCALGVAIHAVVGSAESHNDLKGFKSQPYYDQLASAFNGACIPKLAYVAEQLINKHGLKSFEDIESKGVDLEFDINANGYSDLQNFFDFAELLYLINLTYYLVYNFNSAGVDSPELLNEYVALCAEKAAHNVLQASRVLYVDGTDFEQMTYIPSDVSPLPYLRPLFAMLHNCIDMATLTAFSKDFGHTQSQHLATVVNWLNFDLLKTCPVFNTSSTDYFY